MERGERNWKKKIKKQAVGGKRERGTQRWLWRMTWKGEGCYWGTAVGRKRGAEGKSRRHGKLSKFTFISARICFKRSSCPRCTFAVWTPSTPGRNKTALLARRWMAGQWQRCAGCLCPTWGSRASAGWASGPGAPERLPWVRPVPALCSRNPNRTANDRSAPKALWCSGCLVWSRGSSGHG